MYRFIQIEWALTRNKGISAVTNLQKLGGYRNLKELQVVQGVQKIRNRRKKVFRNDSELIGMSLYQGLCYHDEITI